MKPNTTLQTVAAALLIMLAPAAAAQSRCETNNCRTVIPGTRYDRGKLHRTIFGSRHRDVWRTPVQVEVLDLGEFAGGLSPLRLGGGGQTRSLHFRGADGRRYVFRSVDKDATQGLPAELAMTFVDGVAQDQISALHPYGALVVAPLLEAAGVLHVEPTLMLMPDDERLEAYREEFAGLLGMIEERPEGEANGVPGFAGSSDVVGTNDLFQRLAASPDTLVDARALLTARLMDVYVGDRDRHTDQWRWALFDRHGPARWLPIPRDRDQAFVGLDGVVISVARTYQPALIRFGKDYPNIWGATYSGRGIDRRLLSELDRQAWDSVAVALQQRLSDPVIEKAVRRLPSEVHALNGAWLVDALKARRDRLRDMAMRYYALLASEPDVHGSDVSEHVTVTGVGGGAVEVKIYSTRPPVEPPHFRRIFNPNETREVRLLMHGGDDRVVIGGRRARRVLIRVVGGAGDDELADSSGARGGEPILFYDGRGNDRIERGTGTRVVQVPRPEPDLHERFPPPSAPDPAVREPQNWGGFRLPQIWLSGGSDLGLLVGGGLLYYKYGFRHSPYRYRIDLRAAYATAAATGRAEFVLTAPRVANRIDASLQMRWSGIEVIRFYGLGNGTSRRPPDGISREEFFEVDQQEFLLEPSFAVTLAQDVRLAGGTFFKIVHTERNAGTKLAATLPDQTGRTRKHVGATLGLTADTRDEPRAPNSGFLIGLHGTYNHGLFDELQSYSAIRGHVATYLSPGSPPATPTVAMRISAAKIWGGFPFYDAVFLGGSQTLRGFDRERFAGRAAVLGNLELRLPIGRHRVLVPGRIGVFGLVDAGRVYFEQDAANEIHVAVGGGLWLSFLGRHNTARVSMVRSAEGVRVYARGGFLF